MGHPSVHHLSTDDEIEKDNLEPLPPYTASPQQVSSDKSPSGLEGPLIIAADHQAPGKSEGVVDSSIEALYTPSVDLQGSIGYCVVPAFLKPGLEIGDVVSDLNFERRAPLLRLSTLNLLSENRKSYGKVEFTTTNHQAYDGPLSPFRLQRTIIRTSWTVQNLVTAEIFPQTQFFIENRERLVKTLGGIRQKKAFLIYGVATAGLARITRTVSERRGHRFGFSTMHLGESVEITSRSSCTQENIVVGFRVLSLRLKNGKIEVEKYVARDNF